jgi:hypothetical protein
MIVKTVVCRTLDSALLQFDKLMRVVCLHSWTPDAKSTSRARKKEINLAAKMSESIAAGWAELNASEYTLVSGCSLAK